MDGIDELLAEFITDTQEALEQVDVKLVELETEPEPAAMLNELFRLMHTIKGTCGFLGLPRMAGLAHHAETLMDRLRNGEPVTNDAVDAMLRVVDRLKYLLDAIESAGGKEPEGDDEPIIKALQTAGSDGASERRRRRSRRSLALGTGCRPRWPTTRPPPAAEATAPAPPKTSIQGAGEGGAQGRRAKRPAVAREATAAPAPSAFPSKRSST